VLRWLRGHLPAEAAAALGRLLDGGRPVELAYTVYDWGLNG
jgi:hypothetical protein